MLYSVKIDSANERILITSTDGVLLVDIPSVIVLDHLENIISIGVAPETIQKDSPAEWETIKSQFHFCNPLSIDSFRPVLAARTINRLIFEAIHPTSNSVPPIWKRLFMKDITEWQLHIAGYEKLQERNQKLFEYSAQKTSFVRVSRLSINGRSKEIENIRWAKNSLVFGVTTISISIWLLVMFGTVNFIEIFINEQWQTSTNNFMPLIFIVYLLFFLMFAFCACSLIWKIYVTKFISDAMARIIMEETKMHFPKPIMDFLWRTSSSSKDGG